MISLYLMQCRDCWCVAFSGNLGKDPLPVIDDAIIKLYMGDSLLETLTYKENGIYQSVYKVEEGRTHTLDIDTKGFSKNKISASIPKKERILEIQHLNEAGFDAEGTVISGLNFCFTNTPSEKQYFNKNKAFLYKLSSSKHKFYTF